MINQTFGTVASIIACGDNSGFFGFSGTAGFAVALVRLTGFLTGGLTGLAV